MKNGDRGFIEYNDQVQLYVEVTRADAKCVVLEVINGGYTIYLDIVKVPKKVRENYNEAIEWRKTAPRGKFQYLEDAIAERASEVDDEIPF